MMSRVSSVQVCPLTNTQDKLATVASLIFFGLVQKTTLSVTQIKGLKRKRYCQIENNQQYREM